MTNKVVQTINSERKVKANINPKVNNPSANVITSSPISLRNRPNVLSKFEVTSANAVWDYSLWDNVDWEESSATITKTWIRVFNYNNLFIETFDYDYFYDSSSSSDVTLNTTDGCIEFDPGGIFQSKSIYLDSSVNILKAVINIDAEDGVYIFEMSADGGSNWETVSLGVLHTFTNIGKDLKYRITNNSGTGWPTPWGEWGVVVPASGLIINSVNVRYEVQ